MLNPSEQQQKTVVLWSPPRSRSTLFEKTFVQRPDTTVVHEPFTGVYYLSRWRRSKEEGDDPEMLDYDSQAALQHIQSPQSPLIFVKEIAYAMLPYIDHSFFQTVTNTFIIRPPHESIASLYRSPRNPLSFTEEELGFTALETIWQIVTEELGYEPIVVEGNRFCSHPQEVLMSYCDRIGVEFDPVMLDWKIHQLTLLPYQEPYRSWWEKVEKSTELLPPVNVERNILPEHEKMVERAEKIYEKLVNFAL